MISQSNQFTVHGSRFTVRGGRVNYNTITTNVLTPRLLFDSSFDCCSYSANCVIMFSYSLIIQERVRPLRGVLTQAFSQIPMT